MPDLSHYFSGCWSDQQRVGPATGVNLAHSVFDVAGTSRQAPRRAAKIHNNGFMSDGKDSHWVATPSNRGGPSRDGRSQSKTDAYRSSSGVELRAVGTGDRDPANVVRLIE